LLEDFFSITCSEGSSNFQWWDFRRPTNTTDLAVYAWRAVPSWSMDADWHIASLDLLLVRPVRGHYPLTDGSGGLLSTDDDEILTTRAKASASATLGSLRQPQPMKCVWCVAANPFVHLPSNFRFRRTRRGRLMSWWSGNRPMQSTPELKRIWTL